MHKWAKEIMESVKAKVCAKGIDNIDMTEVEEFKNWSNIAKNIAELDYYCKIVDEMEKPENKYGENYDENGRFYTQSRNSLGQYMSRRRPYDEVYNPMMRNMEESRDMDVRNGKMYYSGMNNNSYGRYENARRGFEEAKAIEPNAEHMKEIEKMMDELETEMRELKPKMTANEKTLAKNKLTTLSSMLM